MSIEDKHYRDHRIVLVFQVHQPRRLQRVSFFDLHNEPSFFNDKLDEEIVRRIARDCYLRTNDLLLRLIEKYPEIKVAFSLSGVVIEQLQAYVPEALDSFQQLARTGAVEFLGETYYHSLAGINKSDEFEIQVIKHAEKMFEVFGVRPAVFRNTELIYNDEIGRRVAMMGYRGILTEGHSKILGDQSPHRLYCHPDHPQLKIFLRNYRLSDDITFRFPQGLDSERYITWLKAMPSGEELINIAIDYETFGEHQKEHTGIFGFLENLLSFLATNDKLKLILPSEALTLFHGNTPLPMDQYLSQAGLQRDLYAWLGNDMQKEAFDFLKNMEQGIKRLENEKLLQHWRHLQASDHFYYMSADVNNGSSGQSSFSPYPSAHEAFVNYMNVATHLAYRTEIAKEEPVRDDHDLSTWEAERQEVKATTPVWVMNLESVPQGNIPDLHG